jgi:hypothetical protein
MTLILAAAFVEYGEGRGGDRVRTDIVTPTRWSEHGLYALKSMDGVIPNLEVGEIPFVAAKAGPRNQINLRPNPDWVPVDRKKGRGQQVNVVVDRNTDIQVLIDGLSERGITPDYGPEARGGS